MKANMHGPLPFFEMFSRRSTTVPTSRGKQFQREAEGTTKKVKGIPCKIVQKGGFELRTCQALRFGQATFWTSDPHRRPGSSKSPARQIPPRRRLPLPGAAARRRTWERLHMGSHSLPREGLRRFLLATGYIRAKHVASGATSV